MEAGLLREYIEIYAPELSVNEYGAQTQTYVKKQETKSQVKYNSGNRGISNDEVITNYVMTFTVRRYVEVNENYIIHYDNKKYRILSIEDNKQHAYKQITGELINE